MPVGRALSRFELHWDTLEEEKWSRDFTDIIERIMEARRDPKCHRPYRGDVWKTEQAVDATGFLDTVLKKYESRF